jgi:hypothetical protein
LYSGSIYYSDVNHSLGTSDVAISLWDTSNNSLIHANDVVAVSTNTLRVYVVGNTKNIRCVVVANSTSVGTSSAALAIQNNAVLLANTPHTSLNFVGFSVVDSGAGVATISSTSAIKAHTYYAASLESPNNADWAVNSVAPSVSDSANLSISIRRFSDTIEQGVGFMFSVPTGSTSIRFKTKSRAATAPAVASVVQPKLYVRHLPDNGAISTWTANNFSNIDIPTNTNFQYDSQTFLLSSLSLTVGDLYQCEFTRSTTVSGGTNLSGDWNLVELIVEFI